MFLHYSLKKGYYLAVFLQQNSRIPAARQTPEIIEKSVSNPSHMIATPATLTIVIIIIVTAFSPTASADHLPLWQLGIGAGVLNAPHYRGSESEDVVYLPVPYITYRGDVFKVDREGIRSEIFESDRLKLDISLAGNIPVPESDSNARAGMPGLDPLIELGPELEYRLWQNSDTSHQLWLKFPFRTVFSIGNPLIDYQGLSFSPYLNYRVNIRKPGTLWRYRVSIGPIFGDEKYHNYFYEVDNEFVTAEREEYHADTGYSGSRITMTLAKNTRKYFVGIFARYDSIDEATFEDSPLIETRNYFIMGLAFAWIFVDSDSRARH